MSDLRYPIGNFQWTPPQSGEQAAKDRVGYIAVLAKLPAKLRGAVQELRPEQLDHSRRCEQGQKGPRGIGLSRRGADAAGKDDVAL